MSTNGNTAAIADEHPWVSQLPAPTREERRQGLLAPVETPVGAKHRPTLLYAGIAVAAILLVVATQLALSISVSNGAYRITSLQNSQKQLDRSYQAASEATDKLASPQNLSANAAALGMVANNSPVYLRLSNGQVIGSPTAASGAAAPASGTTDAPLVANALLNGVPLVTAQGQKPSQVVTDAAPPASQQTGSNTEQGAPATNVDPQQNGPVAWDGPLPAPSTH